MEDAEVGSSTGLENQSSMKVVIVRCVSSSAIYGELIGKAPNRIANPWEPKGLGCKFSTLRHFMKTHTLAQTDPYAPFPTYQSLEHENKGKGKGHDSPVPESSAYGIIFVGLILIFVLLSRYERSGSSDNS